MSNEQRFLYIMRHGEAAPSQHDAQRSLTEKGRIEIQQLVEHCVSMKQPIDEVWCSPLLRSRQTADIVRSQLCPQKHLVEKHSIMPESSVLELKDILVLNRKNIWIVSHLPFVDHFVSYLLCGEERNMINFRPGTIAALEQIGDMWCLAWCIHPTLLAPRTK